MQDVNPVSVTLLISLRPPPISQLRESSITSTSSSAANPALQQSSHRSTNGAHHETNSTTGNASLPRLRMEQVTRGDGGAQDEDGWPSDDGATVVDAEEEAQRPVGDGSFDSVVNREEDQEAQARLQRLRVQRDKQHQIFLQHVAKARSGQASRPTPGSREPSCERGWQGSNGAIALSGGGESSAWEENAITSPSALVIPSTSAEDASISPVSKLFSEGVSIMVDGQSWKYVLMSDSNRNPGEAIIVVFGLRPGVASRIDVCVGPEAVCYAVGREQAKRKALLGGSSTLGDANLSSASTATANRRTYRSGTAALEANSEAYENPARGDTLIVPGEPSFRTR